MFAKVLIVAAVLASDRRCPRACCAFCGGVKLNGVSLNGFQLNGSRERLTLNGSR